MYDMFVIWCWGFVVSVLPLFFVTKTAGSRIVSRLGRTVSSNMVWKVTLIASLLWPICAAILVLDLILAPIYMLVWLVLRRAGRA